MKPSKVHQPLVSICVPTYNGARFIDAALDSVAAQDYPKIELVVVDDGSRDGTVEKVRAWEGGDVRLFVHRRNRGHAATWNETIARSSGSLIKFLHQDDELRSDCVMRMVEALASAPAAGLVFSRRGVILDYQPTPRWRETTERFQRRMDGLAPVNDGRHLFHQWVDAGFPENWIGEPSAVMVRREAVERVGGFAPHIAQTTDIDLWARIMAHFDVCFIDEELAAWRVRSDSLSSTNLSAGAGWLDPLWMLETLSYDDDLVREFPQLVHRRRAARRHALRTAFRLGRIRGGGRAPLRPYLSYVGFRMIARVRPTHAPFARL